MNCLILNRDTFQLPADGWYQIAPLGEFPHAGAGVVQVVDAAACEAMANAFRAEASKPNFAGLLIDFDHFSLDGKQKSEARVGKTADGRPQTEDRDLQRCGRRGSRPSRECDGVEPVPCVTRPGLNPALQGMLTGWNTVLPHDGGTLSPALIGRRWKVLAKR